MKREYNDSACKSRFKLRLKLDGCGTRIPKKVCAPEYISESLDLKFSKYDLY